MWNSEFGCLGVGLWLCGRPGGGGGTLIFSAYVGSDPASTVHPKNISGFQAPPKKSGISSNPKKYLKF